MQKNESVMWKIEKWKSPKQDSRQNQRKRHESNTRDLWDNIKWANLRIIGIPEGAEKDKGMENIFEEIITENFPNLKDTEFKIQEAQRARQKS